MIDLKVEKLLTLADAASLVPRSGGKRIHVATLYRWTQRGVRGHRLEYIQAGASRCTSAEALARFFASLSTPSHAVASMPSPSSDRLERDLIAAGF